MTPAEQAALSSPDQKTWRDIEQASLYEPIAHRIVTLVRRGLDKETALTTALLWMIAQERGRINAEVARISNEIPCIYCGRPYRTSGR